ncbi:MAG: 50S ribosomal protein L25/general stress protein Ctc [Rhodospirillales bacterium]
MSELVNLVAYTRPRAGKGAARAVRRAGQIPAVIYGAKEPPMLIAVDPKEVTKQLHRSGFFTRRMTLTIDGKVHEVLPRDVQLDPLKDRPVHFDFLRTSADSILEVAVPVVFSNEGAAPGIKRGGVLNVVRHDVSVRCRADAIPDKIEIDLTGLDIGDSIHISSVKLPQGVVPVIRERDFTIATIAPPTVIRETEDKPAAAAADGAAAAGATGAAPAAGAAAAAGAKGAPAAGAAAAGAKGAPAAGAKGAPAAGGKK